MYYLRTLYLNPNTGRFWTMDSYEGNNSDPLSLHKYLYCRADPINGMDPSGHEYTYVGIGSTMTLGIEMALMYVHASANATRKAQMISASVDPEFASLIYGLEVADIVMDKVTLVMAAAGLTHATVKVATFLSKYSYKFLARTGSSSVRTIAEFNRLAARPDSYYTYTELRALISEAGLGGSGKGLEAHHLVHKTFASKLGLNEGDIISVPLTPLSHRNAGGPKVDIGAGDNIYGRIVTRLQQYGTTPKNASVEQIWKAHRSVYDDIGHPEWAEAIYEAYFKSHGLSFY